MLPARSDPPLSARAQLLYALLGSYAERAPGLEIARPLAELTADLQQHLMFCLDLALFRTGVVERFLAGRGTWLRPDERALVERWRAIPLTFYEVVDGLELASGGELAHVRRHLPGAPLAFGGPGKTDAELAAAVTAGVQRYHVESLLELRRLDAVARAGGAVAEVLLRVNVTGGAAADAVLTMGGAPSPFGMDPDEADTCAEQRRTLPGVRLAGVHAHIASGLGPAACAAQGDAVLGWALAFAHRHGLALREVNVGGGMAVDYRRPGHLFDWADYTGRLCAHALARLGGTPGPVLRIEPGRAVSAYSGWYASRVLELKRSHGEWFAVCLGGTHHLRTPAAKGHDQPLVVLPDETWERPDTGAAAPPVTFVGQLCTPKDVLARRVHAGRVRTGDQVVFALAGAYSFNISHRDFLLHPAPRVVHLGGAADVSER